MCAFIVDILGEIALLSGFSNRTPVLVPSKERLHVKSGQSDGAVLPSLIIHVTGILDFGESTRLTQQAYWCGNLGYTPDLPK